MRKYESLVIFHGSLGEDKIATEVERISKFLRDRNVLNLHTEHWGRRDIAYSVARHTRGIYVIFYFETADSMFVKDLTYQYRISESIMKFQTHLINEKVRKTLQLQTEESEGSESRAASA